MQRRTAIWAEKLSLAERHLYNSPTDTAFLAGVSWISTNDLSTASYCFVGQHINESSPRHITDMLGKAMVSNHSFDIQIFNCNERIGFSEPATELVQEVSPLVGNLVMQSGDFESCFIPVFASFDFSAQPSLQEFQSLFGFNQMSWISDELSIRDCSKVFNANIYANPFCGLMFDFNIRQLTGEAGKPLSSFVLFDCKGFNFTLWDSMQDNWNASNLAEFKLFVRKQFETRLRECYTINSAFESRKPFLLAGFVLDSAKEVFESLVNSIRNVLDNLTMSIRRIAFDYSIIIKFCQRYFAKFISVYGCSKKVIISRFAYFKVVNEFNLLFRRRIHTIFEHLLNDHRTWEYQPIYKLIGGIGFVNPNSSHL